MEDDASSLEEVVVVAYGEKSRKNVILQVYQKLEVRPLKI